MDLLDKPVQDSVNPQNVRVLAVKAVILIFSLILLYAVVVGLPYLIALAHGVPLDGNLHGRDRYGMSRVYPLRPMVTFSVITFIVITPPLLVAAALLRDWTAARNK